MTIMFSTRLRELRQAKDLSENQLVGLIPIDAATISALEKGIMQPSLEALSRIADVFGTTTDYLLGRSAAPSYEQYGLEEQDATELRTLTSILVRKDNLIRHLQARNGEPDSK